MFDFMASRLTGELEWARSFERRLRDGAYRFADDTLKEARSMDSQL
jgi:hypothetical protein